MTNTIDRGQRSEQADISARLARRRLAGSKLRFVTRRALHCKRPEAGVAVPIVRLAEIRSAGHDVVVRIERIGAETVAQPKVRPCLGHDLHQPDRAFWGHRPHIA